MKKRPGKTEKISVSLDREDIELLRKRAKRVHSGNVSKAVADAVRYLRYEEGRDALLESFGELGKVTPREVDDIAREWQAPKKSEKRARTRSKRAA